MVEEKEKGLHVSSSYQVFWEDTVIALEKTIYSEKHSPVWKSRDLFHLNFTGVGPLIECRLDVPGPNRILFRYIMTILYKVMLSSWPRRKSSPFFMLNNLGKPFTPGEMAYSLYDMVCTAILDDYSVILDVPLRTVTELASIGYEKSDFNGTRLVFDIPSDGEKSVIYFSEVYFSDENLRAVRKVSAGVENDLALYISNSPSKPQILSCQGYCPASKEALADYPVLITLWGKRKWSLSMYGTELFRVAGRQVQATEPLFRESQAVKRLKEELNGFSLIKRRNFDLLLEVLSKQKHGTSVIFSTFSTPFIHDYLERLVKLGRAQPLHGFHIVEKDKAELGILTSMARVDGAFVIDLEATKTDLKKSPDPANRCSMYMGVLLDSPAVSQGFTGHGARANSVLAFVQEAIQQVDDSAFKIAALVFSEDGYVLPILGSEARELKKTSQAVQISLINN